MKRFDVEVASGYREGKAAHGVAQKSFADVENTGKKIVAGLRLTAHHQSTIFSGFRKIAPVR